MEIKKRALGNSGLSVKPIGLGALPLSLQGRPSEQDAIKVIHAALDAGIDLIDTADVYCIDQNDIGHNERLIAKALKTSSNSQKNKIIVATKGGMVRPHGAWLTNGEPKHLKQACEASLKALGVDCIDLYQWHDPDPKVPFEVSMEALIDLKKSGKIKALGLSNVSISEIIKARGMTDIASVQNRCNPFDVDSFKNGVVEYCEENGIAFIAYSPVGGASQKYLTAKDPALIKVAKNHETFQATPFQVALAWLLVQSPILIPIPGASRIQSAESSAKAMSLPLKKEEIELLNRAFLG